MADLNIPLRIKLRKQEAQAHRKPEETIVRMTCYTARLNGEIMPDSEI